METREIDERAKRQRYPVHVRQRMRTAVRILMIDDHPSQIEGYKVILEYNTQGIKVETTACFNCESAYHTIISSNPFAFDLVFLDRSMPPYPDKNITTGEDLASVIKQFLPTAKIVILTSHSETFLLYNIVKKIDPIGLLVKSDFSADDLLVAFDIMMGGEHYHSQTVKQSIKEFLAKESYLDHYNRQIIILLAQGIKTKNMPAYLNMSLSAIEKRKSLVKDYLCVEKGGDEDIVREAKRLGFV